MGVAETLIESVLRRNRVIRSESPESMVSSPEMMKTIAQQVNAAPRLAVALQVLLTEAHLCVEGSFDEEVRRRVTEALRHVNDVCAEKHPVA